MDLKGLVLVGGACVGVAGGGAVAAGVVVNTPKNAFAIAMSSAIKDVTEREEVKYFTDVLSGGSLGFSFQGIEDKNGNSLTGDVSAEGKLYFAKNAIAAEDITISAEGMELSASIYASEKEVVIEEYDILGGAYGIEFDTLLEDLENSIFAPGESQYSMPSEAYDIIVDTLENMKSSDNKEMAKDAKKLAETVAKDAWKIVTDNASFNSYDERDLRRIEMYVGTYELEGIITDSWDYLYESKDLKSFMEKYNDKFISIYELATQEEFEERYFSDWFYDLLDEVDIDEAIDDMYEYFTNIQVNVYTPKLLPHLVEMDVLVGGEEIISIDVGEKGIKKTDEITITYADSLEMTYSFVNDKNQLAVSLSVDAEDYGGNYVEIELEADKKSESYELTVMHEAHYGAETTQIGVEGQMATKGKTTTMTIEEVSLETTSEYGSSYEQTYYVDCELVISTSDKMPEAPSYEKISDITESDIEEIIENINNFGK